MFVFLPQRFVFISPKQGRWASNALLLAAAMALIGLPPGRVGPVPSWLRGSLLVSWGVAGREKQTWARGSYRALPAPPHPPWAPKGYGPDKLGDQRGSSENSPPPNSGKSVHTRSKAGETCALMGWRADNTFTHLLPDAINEVDCMSEVDAFFRKQKIIQNEQSCDSRESGTVESHSSPRYSFRLKSCCIRHQDCGLWTLTLRLVC